MIAVMKRKFGQGIPSLLCLCLIATSVSFAQQKRFGKYYGPRSLGTYTHERRVSLQAFLAQFGAKPTGKYAYCFTDKVHGLYLHAKIDDEHDRGRVVSLFLSSFPNCRHVAEIG